MSSATMTMLGMSNYVPDLFDDLTFPAGIDKETAVDEILLRSGEFEVLYSNPAFLKQAITHWGKKHYRTFEEWVRALAINFDPLYNYDRFEEYTDAKVASGSLKSSGETSNNANSVAMNETAGKEDNTTQSMSQTYSDGTGSSSNQRDVSAYDSATYEPREKETGSSGNTGSGDGMAFNQAKNDTSGSSKDLQSSSNNEQMSRQEDSTNAEQTKHTAHLYGNIGVTTSTQMLEDFLRVERFTIYEEIADMFVTEFCIMVY